MDPKVDDMTEYEKDILAVLGAYGCPMPHRTISRELFLRHHIMDGKRLSATLQSLKRRGFVRLRRTGAGPQWEETNEEGR